MTVRLKLIWNFNLYMDKLLKNAFKMQIQSKEGFEFEEFIDELLKINSNIEVNV